MIYQEKPNWAKVDSQVVAEGQPGHCWILVQSLAPRPELCLLVLGPEWFMESSK